MPRPTGSGAVTVPPRGSQSASRAASVLLLLAEQRRTLSLTEISQLLGVAKSSTRGVLVSLEASGLIHRDDNKYGLAPTVLTLAAGYLQSDDIVRHFRRVVAQLPVLAQEVVQMGTLVERDVVFLARHAGRSPLAMTANVADRFPASITALGKALLARLDDAELRRRYPPGEPLPRWTDASVTTVEELMAQLEQVRADGFSRDQGETNPHVCGVAVALRGSRRSIGDLAVGASLRPLVQAESHVAAVVQDLYRLRDELESHYLLE